MDVDIFNEIDQIINLDIGGRKSRYLYQSARKSIPLCLESAELIKNSIKEHGTVLITSGFPVIPNRRPETDGPPGAVVFARAMEDLGVTPIFVVDELSLKVHSDLAKMVGLKTVKTETVPVDLVEAKETCSSILIEHNPCLLLAIERPGMNKDGIYCNMRGEDASALVGKVDPMFVDALNKNISTIGIGDGGNEIGMGNISQAVVKYISHGSSIASVTKVRSLVVSAVSNWGAYGIVAALSMITGRQLGHDAELERKMIETCIKSGAVDGVSKKAQHSVDGLPSHFHEHMVEIIRYISDKTLAEK